MKIREKFWLWGQAAGSHNMKGNPFNLPAVSRMTPLEGTVYFGIPNTFFVVMDNKPQMPFDQDAMVLDGLRNVVWSIIGDGSTGRTEFIDEVLRLARIYPNITGGIMDDFMSEGRMKIFTVEKVRQYKERLHHELDRRLDLWTVIYDNELTEERRPYIAECDKLTLWTKFSKDLVNLEENYRKLRDLSDDQEIYAGCYLWDHNAKHEVTRELMNYQLDKYYEWLLSGKIEGVILCSNCNSDIGLEAPLIAREWLRIHGDETI